MWGGRGPCTPRLEGALRTNPNTLCLFPARPLEKIKAFFTGYRDGRPRPPPAGAPPAARSSPTCRPAPPPALFPGPLAGPLRQNRSLFLAASGVAVEGGGRPTAPGAGLRPRGDGDGAARGGGARGAARRGGSAAVGRCGRRPRCRRPARRASGGPRRPSPGRFPPWRLARCVPVPEGDAQGVLPEAARAVRGSQRAPLELWPPARVASCAARRPLGRPRVFCLPAAGGVELE